MKNFIKKKIKIFLKYIFEILLEFNLSAKLLTLSNSFEKYEKKKIFGKEIYLIKKNYITKYRNDTILTKEPETIKWIQGMDKNSTFYDVGANIGLYSITAALLNSKKVVAFEPSFFNLQILSKNIFFNNLSKKIIIVPVSLDNKISQGFFNLKSIEEGGALSTFETGSNHFKSFDDKNILNKKKHFNYNTISITLDEFYKNFRNLKPDYLKIDVDGIETKILTGGLEVIKSVKSILVESNTSIDDKEIIKIMNFNNFKLIYKNNDSFNLIFNKI